MQAESARLGRILRPAPAAARPPRLERGGRPVQLRRRRRRAVVPGVSAGSPRRTACGRNPVTGIYKLHDGTDFGVGCGTPVHAAASGTVIQTALTVGYGNQLVIDHGVDARRRAWPRATTT